VSTANVLGWAAELPLAGRCTHRRNVGRTYRFKTRNRDSSTGPLLGDPTACVCPGAEPKLAQDVLDVGLCGPL
jgi:hypothetical protein